MYAEASGDDAINVFGVVHDTVAVMTPSQFILGPTFYPPYNNPEVGDVLQFISPNGQVRGTAQVGTVTGALGSNLSVATTSDAPAGFDTTWKIANVSAVPQEFVLRNSRFRYVRGRGVVSQAQKNLIVANRFDHGSSGPILLFFSLPFGRQGPMPSKRQRDGRQ
jgi:hypothetical protein